VRHPVSFLIVYFVCGATDAADGFIARKYNAQTALGAKLDSFGDFLFFGVALFSVFTRANRAALLPLALVMAGIAAIRAANLVITKVKFGQLSALHTIGNKIAGLALFAAVPACIILGDMPIVIAAVAGGLCALSALEETLILLIVSTYTINLKGIWCAHENPH